MLNSGTTAQYGKGMTTVLLATKSGTNQYRGSVFGYGRNEKLIATDYFSKPENGGLGKAALQPRPIRRLDSAVRSSRTAPSSSARSSARSRTSACRGPTCCIQQLPYLEPLEYRGAEYALGRAAAARPHDPGQGELATEPAAQSVRALRDPGRLSRQRRRSAQGWRSSNAAKSPTATTRRCGRSPRAGRGS